MAPLSVALANKNLERIQAYEPGKPIEELERELGIRGAIKMASNENPFGPSPKAVRAASAALAKANRYPDASCFYLKKELARRFSVPTDSVILGNGSDELIVLAVRAFLKPGEEVLTATPTFLIYRIAALVEGGVPVEIPMKSFRYDLDRMLKAVTDKTKIIFIANPDNPVGTYVTHKELAKFVAAVPERCLIFIDEAYYEFAAGREGYPKSFSFLNKPNVVIARTFSKAYGLSGLRIGYGFSNPEVIRAMNKVREPFNVNSAAQAGALAALSDTGFLKKVIKTTAAQKKKLYSEFNRLRIPAIESATNFILIRLGSAATGVYERLLKRGIITRSMRGWGLGEFIRVTVGTPRENRQFLKQLKSVLKDMNWRGIR